MKPANFLTRSFTALVFGVLMIVSILSGVLYFAGLMLFVLITGMIEFYKLVLPKVSEKARIAGIVSGSVIYILIFSYNLGLVPGTYFWGIPVLLFLPFLIAMSEGYSNSISTIGTTLAGITLIAVPLALFASLIPAGDKYSGIPGREFLLGFLVILWVYDSAAYLVGSMIGKHKLYERLSPAKTWEGSLGGLVFGIAVAWAIAVYYIEISLLHWMAIALIIIVFGTLGDLCESMLKRNAGVKDSGKLLPGHGGILDRFDAVLMSAPVVYFYMVAFF
jgi:phosphatidate cytidylyltransferase